MQYRKMVRAGFEVSEIGLGCEHLEKKDQAGVDAVVGAARDGGINILDVFMPGLEVRTRIGEAVRNNRDQLHIQGHIGAILEDGQYKRSRDVEKCSQHFMDLLTRLHTDSLSIGTIHFVDTLEDWNVVESQGLLEYALGLKQKGLIRAVGMSSHEPVTALQAVRSGHLDVLMFSINPSFDLLPEKTNIDDLFEKKTFEEGAAYAGMNPVRQELYETCARMGVGITVMKTLAAGGLLSAESSPLGAALTVTQCEHYSLTRPGVVSALIGCASAEEVRQALAYETLSEQEKDYTAVLAASNRYTATGACMYCNHCLPCPQQIDIAALLKFYDLAKNQLTLPDSLRDHYRLLNAHASDCIECYDCEERCPFGVDVTGEMRKAAELFGV
jgi:predicted aldo/keto reductase-like oxidoreductase